MSRRVRCHGVQEPKSPESQRTEFGIELDLDSQSILERERVFLRNLKNMASENIDVLEIDGNEDESPANERVPYAILASPVSSFGADIVVSSNRLAKSFETLNFQLSTYTSSLIFIPF